MTRPRIASPEDTRWTVAFNAVTAAVPVGEFVRHSTRRRIASAVLAELGTSGYLAPLPGEQDKRLTDLLAEVEHRLDEKGAIRG